jgi:hypothetical protein
MLNTIVTAVIPNAASLISTTWVGNTLGATKLPEGLAGREGALLGRRPEPPGWTIGYIGANHGLAAVGANGSGDGAFPTQTAAKTDHRLAGSAFHR